MSTPLVSVSMIAYKHADFISEAIKGVLNQKVDFPVELIITDDCSNDDTEKVVRSFSSHSNYGWVKYFGHHQNLGLYENIKFNLENCSGKYIAFCEGDDYWTDPLKLQKQVSVLKEDSEISMVFSSREVLEADGSFHKGIISEGRVTKHDFYLHGITFPFQTMLIRNYGKSFMDFLEKNSNSYGFDKLIGYYCLLQGDSYGIADITAVYRHNGLGAWSRLTPIQKTELHIEESLKFYNLIEKHNFDKISSDQLKFNLFRRVIRNTALQHGIAQAKEIIKKYNPPKRAIRSAYIDYAKHKLLRR